MKKQVIILGAGKSINEGISKGLWSKIKNKEIWSLNSMFKIMPYLPTRELWVDISFFRHTVGELQKLAQQGVKLIAKKHLKLTLIPQIEQFETTKEQSSASENILYVGSQGLVGFFALSLAIVREKYDEVFVLGYDYGTPNINDKVTHCYENKKKELNIYSTGNIFVYFNKNGTLKREVEDFKYYLQFSNKIYNVSLYSNIPYFEKISWEEFFEKIK